jgi:hypothetical protein
MTTRPKPSGPPYKPNTEHKAIIDALKQALGRTAATSITQKLLVNKDRLYALAKHADTKIEYNDRTPIIRMVTVVLRTKDGREATAYVRALGPLLGRREPYTREELEAEATEEKT